MQEEEEEQEEAAAADGSRGYLSNQTTVCPSGIWSSLALVRRQFSIEACGTQSPWSSISGRTVRTAGQTDELSLCTLSGQFRYSAACNAACVAYRLKGTETERRTEQRNLSFGL